MMHQAAAEAGASTANQLQVITHCFLFINYFLK